MRRSVCIVSPGNLASNPRVLKEADALHDAGYEVTLVACNYTKTLRAADDEIAAAAPWKVVRLPRTIGQDFLTRTWQRLARPLWRRGNALPFELAARACGGPAVALRRHVQRLKADLYIAHYVAALPAAAAAARRHDAALAFDAEDFHSGEGAPGDEFRMAMVRAVEQAVLPDCAYVTASAPLIGEAYAEQYGIPRPATLLNVFPLAMAPRMPKELPVEDAPLRAYWFSQTIGLDRGLQSFLQAMARAKTAVTLDIRGDNRWGHGDALLALARSLGIEDRVKLLPLAPPQDMVRLAAGYDIGLSLETNVSENRLLCLTNKVFTYLLAGVPVMMSDTPAQKLISADLGAAARLVVLDEPATIAAELDRLPSSLAESSAAAWRLGRERYNWNVEKAVLLNAVENVLIHRGQEVPCRH